MELQFKEMIAQITDFMKSEAKTKTVIGEPFQLGEFSCIPVIRVGMGFGSGGGEGIGKGGVDAKAPKEGRGEGAGVGAGMAIDPIGFLVSREGHIAFVNTKTNSGLSAAFEKVPELIEKFMEMRKTADVAEV